MGANPAATTVGNTLTAQAILFDSELIPNLKGETNAFMEFAVKRVQGEGTGINRSFFQYEELGSDLSPAADGNIGDPEYVGQLTQPAQIGEWNNFCNFSAFVTASAIDDVVGNTAIELGYQAGQTISELYSETLDGLSSLDSNVNQNALLTTPFLLSWPVIRTMKNQLVNIGVQSRRDSEFVGAISPAVVNDLANATSTSAQTIFDLLKFTKEGHAKFEEIAGVYNQTTPIRLPGTAVCFYQTPFVHTTASYGSTAYTAYRTYIGGDFGLIGVWLTVPGDTDLGDGDWRTIECKVTENAASSAYDPVAT